MKLLLDTHVWVWYLTGASQLTASARQIVEDEQTQLWLSPISVWEVMILAEKGRLRLQPDSTIWVRKAIEVLSVREAPLNSEIAIQSRQINLPHQDPADRFIAATALLYEMPLMTFDERLRSADWLQTLPQ